MPPLSSSLNTDLTHVAEEISVDVYSEEYEALISRVFKTTDFDAWLDDISRIACLHEMLWEKAELMKNFQLALFIKGLKPAVVRWCKKTFQRHPTLTRTKSGDQYWCSLLSMNDNADQVFEACTSWAFKPELLQASYDEIKAFPLPDYADRRVTEEEYYSLHQLVYGFWLAYVAEARQKLLKEEEVVAAAAAATDLD
jgi:hypothetical protein